MNDTELIPYDSRTDLTVAREPDVVLAEAKKAAVALRSVIAAKVKPVIFNNEQYLEFEDWQTVARFYGATVKVVSTQFIDLGGVQGFEAKAVVLNVNTGMEISAADAMCLNDEDKWSTRTKYEYQYVLKSGGHSTEDPGKEEIVWEDNPKKAGSSRPKKERVKVGEDRVPLFQLRSMAQTRACAKALRNVFAWVVVLAGYRATPAEEMDGVERDHAPAQQQRQQQVETDTRRPTEPRAPAAQNHTEENQNPVKSSGGGQVISEAQAKRAYAIATKDRGLTTEQYRELVKAFGFNSDRDITRDKYEQIIAAMGAKHEQDAQS